MQAAFPYLGLYGGVGNRTTIPNLSGARVVIVHELLHLRVANHGKLFKSLIRAYLPGWETFTNDVKCTRV